jgi:beta-1,4-N-acetylglucosaminyltransferase
VIFVTVGTPQQPFTRLVKAVDEFAAHTEEKVIIQAGTTTYEPQHAEYFRWTTSEAMLKFTKESRIVITQASAGAIILALKYGRPLILVPRLSKYQEHYNDHQYQLAFALRDQGKAVLADDLTVAGLQEAVNRVLAQEVIHGTRDILVNNIKRQIQVWYKQIEQE